jgi:hypothetical protein
MLKLLEEKPVVPKSLYLSGVTIKYDSEHTKDGGFGRVHCGVYKGKDVAVKSLFADRSGDVRLHFSMSNVLL